jgi:hypothetical protein
MVTKSFSRLFTGAAFTFVMFSANAQTSVPSPFWTTANQSTNVSPAIFRNSSVGIGTMTGADGLEINVPLAQEWVGATNIRMGLLGGSPRIILSKGGKSFEMDTDMGRYRIYIPGKELFSITEDGKVAIGTTNPDAKLTVSGGIHAKEVLVDLNIIAAPDYVFEPTYELMPLSVLAQYLQKNKHLPEVPAGKELEANGVNVAEMNMLLLKKVEELTLYMIELKQENDALKQRVETLEKK